MRRCDWKITTKSGEVFLLNKADDCWSYSHILMIFGLSDSDVATAESESYEVE